jgi:uncharacterized phage-associated protein
MATVHDVAAAVLERTGSISTFKLQKLVYYSQAWHLVWDEEPLFRSSFEAWANGPVCRDLYNEHRRSFAVASWPMGDASRLTRSEAETVDAVVDAYAHLNGQQLSRLTHAEEPWRAARAGLRPGQRGDAVIKKSAMAAYYGSIDSADDSVEVEDIGAVLEGEEF